MPEPKNKIINNFSYAMHQAHKYWRFLYFTPEDVEQVVYLSLAENPNVTSKNFSLLLNRNLYRLARDLGFRKRGYGEGTNSAGNWWERQALSWAEVEGEGRRWL